MTPEITMDAKTSHEAEPIIVSASTGPNDTPGLRGNMGLTGLFATLGNATAMLIIAVVLFISLYQIQHMHQEGIATLKELHLQERSFNREMQAMQNKTIERNTEAIKELVSELRNRK